MSWTNEFPTGEARHGWVLDDGKVKAAVLCRDGDVMSESGDWWANSSPQTPDDQAFRWHEADGTKPEAPVELPFLPEGWEWRTDEHGVHSAHCADATVEPSWSPNQKRGITGRGDEVYVWRMPGTVALPDAAPFRVIAAVAKANGLEE